MAVLKTLVKTGIEEGLKRIAPHLTDTGKTVIKGFTSSTDKHVLQTASDDTLKQFAGFANKNDKIQLMNGLDKGAKEIKQGRRQAQVIDATIPTVKYKKGGSLEAPRKVIQDFVEADPTRKEKLLSGEIKRGSIANIMDETGDIKDIQGMTKFLTSMNANFLTFPSRVKRKASKGVRLNLMKAPEPELRKFAAAEFPDNPELIEEYLKTYARGFSAVQEAARRNGIIPRQLWE